VQWRRINFCGTKEQKSVLSCVFPKTGGGRIKRPPRAKARSVERGRLEGAESKGSFADFLLILSGVKRGAAAEMSR